VFSPEDQRIGLVRRLAGRTVCRTQWGMHDTTSLFSIVERVDSMVDDQLRETDQRFRLGRARLYVLDTDGGLRLEAEDENPYDLLVVCPRADDVRAAVLVVTGWAAPLGADGQAACRPSEHPERERIRLGIGVADEGIVTLMRRASEPGEVMTMGERGVGDIPDALDVWWNIP
jgi:hypothetical protein